jgi:hypothetical protein
MNKKLKTRIKNFMFRRMLGDRYIVITMLNNSADEAVLNCRGLSPIQELALLEDTWSSLRNDPETIEYARQLGEQIIDEEFARIAYDYDGLGNEIDTPEEEGK